MVYERHLTMYKLACCDSWGRKELDTIEWQLNWTELTEASVKIQVVKAHS